MAEEQSNSLNGLRRAIRPVSGIPEAKPYDGNYYAPRGNAGKMGLTSQNQWQTQNGQPYDVVEADLGGAANWLETTGDKEQADLLRSSIPYAKMLNDQNKLHNEYQARMQQGARDRNATFYENNLQKMQDAYENGTSWGDALSNNSAVQNTIGYRVLNPYTGQIESRIPKGGAEWTSSLLQHGVENLASFFNPGMAGVSAYNAQIDNDNILRPFEYEKQMGEDTYFGKQPAMKTTYEQNLASNLNSLAYNDQHMMDSWYVKEYNIARLEEAASRADEEGNPEAAEYLRGMAKRAKEDFQGVIGFTSTGQPKTNNIRVSGRAQAPLARAMESGQAAVADAYADNSISFIRNDLMGAGVAPDEAGKIAETIVRQNAQMNALKNAMENAPDEETRRSLLAQYNSLMLNRTSTMDAAIQNASAAITDGTVGEKEISDLREKVASYEQWAKTGGLSPEEMGKVKDMKAVLAKAETAMKARNIAVNKPDIKFSSDESRSGEAKRNREEAAQMVTHLISDPQAFDWIYGTPSYGEDDDVGRRNYDYLAQRTDDFVQANPDTVLARNLKYLKDTYANAGNEMEMKLAEDYINAFLESTFDRMSPEAYDRYKAAENKTPPVNKSNRAYFGDLLSNLEGRNDWKEIRDSQEQAAKNFLYSNQTRDGYRKFKGVEKDRQKWENTNRMMIDRFLGFTTDGRSLKERRGSQSLGNDIRNGFKRYMTGSFTPRKAKASTKFFNLMNGLFQKIAASNGGQAQSDSNLGFTN